MIHLKIMSVDGIIEIEFKLSLNNFSDGIQLLYAM